MSEHITHTPQIKRLERTSDHKVIAGVCGGLGRYFDLNPAVFRLGLVVLALLGGAGILVAVGALLTLIAVAACVALVTAFAWFNVSLGDGVGSRTYAPATASAVASSYHLGIGTLKVDLSGIGTAGTHHVEARLGIGELKVVVPRDADVHVDAHANAGELFVLSSHDDGRNASIHAGTGRLEIDARVGAGRIDVVRAR